MKKFNGSDKTYGAGYANSWAVQKTRLQKLTESTLEDVTPEMKKQAQEILDLMKNDAAEGSQVKVMLSWGARNELYEFTPQFLNDAKVKGSVDFDLFKTPGTYYNLR